MKLIDIQSILEEWCPLKNAEDFDNVGLLVGDPSSEINKALITIDTTEKIIDEAINKKCNLIITFHPLIFKGIKSLKSENYVNKCIVKAIKNNINIYAIHTNLDNNPEGVSFKIAQKLNLINTSLLIQKEENSNLGMGIIGEINESKSELDFLEYLKEKMFVTNIRHSKFLGKKIKKIAVLGGSGSFAIEEVLTKKVDCYVTADLKYHDFFKSNDKVLLVDIGHYESEKYTKDLILNYLNKKIPKFACIIAKTRTNPVNYF
tara:strand:+ start:2356 stop:3138 length:783 start_codon:yes stop_codon:yes gene_type:complete